MSCNHLNCVCVCLRFLANFTAVPGYSLVGPFVRSRIRALQQQQQNKNKKQQHQHKNSSSRRTQKRTGGQNKKHSSSSSSSSRIPHLRGPSPAQSRPLKDPGTFKRIPPLAGRRPPATPSHPGILLKDRPFRSHSGPSFVMAGLDFVRVTGPCLLLATFSRVSS